MKFDLYEAGGRAAHLVVVLHGSGGSPAGMESVNFVTRRSNPDTDILTPYLPYGGVRGMFSFARAEDISRKVVNEIDRLFAKKQYRSIRIVGHSYGGVIARKIVILAHGQMPDAPFEQALKGMVNGTSWAACITRVVLLAGINRGWSPATARNWFLSVQWKFASAFGEVLTLVFRRRPTLFAIRQGAPFIIQTRLQWLALMQHRACTDDAARASGFLVVQTLGTVDDYVAPSDVIDHAIDSTTEGNCYFLEMPDTGHRNAIEMRTGASDPPLPTANEIAAAVRGVMSRAHTSKDEIERIRAAILALALSCSREELQKLAIPPAHLGFDKAPNPHVRHLVFVIHGIRDRGFWTQKIGRAILQESDRQHANGEAVGKCAILAPSYGYFAMAPFLMPWVRRQKAEWFMDQYTEARALYPNADISFVGHSNGTYLAARSLLDYPALKFKRMVFAGSVVRKRYDWTKMLNSIPPRVDSVLNYVATHDVVVALFPNGLQPLSFFFDLGSAGHTGFVHKHEISPKLLQQVKFVVGAHSAGIKETQWDDIARFVVSGTVPMPEAGSRKWGMTLAGLLSPALLAGLAALLLWIGWKLLNPFLPFLAAASIDQVLRAAAFPLYCIAIYLILSRV